MKKTIITLMALSGVAAADTITSNAFTDTANWTTGSGRGRGQFVVADGRMTLVNSNWGQAYANYNLTSAITLNHETSFTFSIDIVTPTNDQEQVITLVTSSGSYLMGRVYGNEAKTVSYGSTTATTVGDKDAVTYAFNTEIDTKNAVNVTPTGTMGTTPVYTTSATGFTLTGTVSWDGDSYSMLLNDGTNPAMTWDLGATEFSLEKISFYGDGANNTTDVVYSNLALSTAIVPEPATATLSLLALAGLASRRRRK